MSLVIKRSILGLFLLMIVISQAGIADETLVSPIFLKRHSGKFYDTSRQVSNEQIRAMIESARWAPSSHNDQPWNFIICDRIQTPEAFAKALDTIKATNQKWAKDAALLIVVVARTKLLYKGKPNEYAEYDTGSAAISMALQAADLGLMAHQLGGIDKEKIVEVFQLPENCVPMTIMAIGYETDELETSPKPRDRRPSEENFFMGRWGQP